MTTRLTDHLLERLFELGQAIDIGRPVIVFDGGQVGLDNDYKAKEYEDERQGSRGPAAGSREGAAGAWRSSCEARDSVGSVWPEWLIKDGLALLLGSYPGSRVSLDGNGAWLGVTASPEGREGPQAIFIIALPKCRLIHPRCWAFWVEALSIRCIGPRHTNYPYADACAFPQFEGHWERRHGICSYVDIHAEWLIRQLHHAIFDRWVGSQLALFALYALNQFGSNEQCHCRNGCRYGECCQPKDFAEWRMDPVRQVRLALEFTQYRWFNSQRPPREIMQFALGGEPPDLANIYRLYREFIRFTDRAKTFSSRLLLSCDSAGLTAQSAAWKIAA
jgi:hypothetical protein